jgi:hypothetical protein
MMKKRQVKGNIKFTDKKSRAMRIMYPYSDDTPEESEHEVQ